MKSQTGAKLIQLVKRAVRWDELSAEQFSEEAARRLRRIQIRGAIDQMRIFIIGNTFFAPVLAFQAWDAGINGLVIAWTVVLLAFSWWVFFRWRTSYRTDGSEVDMKVFVAETRLNAGLWCSGMILFYGFVDGDEKTVLTTVMAGSLALGTVGFSQAPRAAIWYLGIQAVTITSVPITFGLFWGTQSDILLGGLALVASAAIFNAVLERARAQVKAFQDHEALTQKKEVIDLLMKDYEEQGVEWVWRTDSRGVVLGCPQQVLELLGNPDPADLDFDLVDAIKSHVDPSGAEDLEKVQIAFATKQEFHDVTLPLHSHAKGNLRWIMMRGRPQYENGVFVGFSGIFADATTAMEAQKRVEFLAKHDPLTGTFNRNMLQSHLGELDPDVDTATVYLIDLDGFKQVNDSYGHAIGDELLILVAQRLLGLVGPDDIVARLGGDEFLVLTESSNKHDCLSEDSLGARMLATLSKPILVGRYDIALSASIGTAHFPIDTGQGPNLLNQADLALYAAKRGGRNQCVAFVESMQVGLQKRLTVIERLRHAVQENQIVPFYQPQYCAQTERLVGFETLARWTDPELGIVAPDIFIQIAEETGLIHEIGESLLRAACDDASAWPKGEDGEPLTVSVNVSPVQVMRGNLVQMVKSVLNDTRLPPQQLEIEVTEGVLIDDMVGTFEVLQELSELGVGIALDDFGTGYSSLSYIRALPLNRLKIDRSFVADIDKIEARLVVQTIIDLCRRLDLSVIAEGVETQVQVEMLRQMQCDILQGYLFSRPVAAAELPPIFEKTSARAA